MKYSIFFFLSLFLIACNFNNSETYLVSEGNSEYTIIVDKNCDSTTQYAAEELQNYIQNISGTKIAISNKRDKNRKEILIGKGTISDSLLIKKIENLKEDAFIIDTKSDDFFFGGKSSKSDIYATYTFIEEFLKCKLLTTKDEIIPKSETIKIPKNEKTYSPAFSFRRVLLPRIHDKKYRYWHKTETLEDWGSFVHTFHRLISPKEYFEEHPEYFSLIRGRRLQDAQLCLSNPEVIKLLGDNLEKEIAKNPEKKYWSVSQNDCYNYCECENCKKLYKKYDSYSGAYIFMANKIAERFPDKIISTLAYQFTRSAPKNITPRENVNIMFCSIECNRSMPLVDDKRSSSFVKEMEDWSKLTNNIFVWDYVVQFKNYLTPFPNFHVLQPNIQFFKKNNVNMMFQQGSNGAWSDLAELKEYLISKLLWNPDINVDSTVKVFMKDFYGPAEPYIYSYYKDSQNELKKYQEEEFLNIYGFPCDYFDSFLNEKQLLHYKDLMDKAEEITREDSVYLKRVKRARLAVDFAYIDIALNKNLEHVSFFNVGENGKEIRPEMIEYLNTFVKNSIETEADNINERSFKTSAYQEYALKKIELLCQENLAKNAKITLLTQPSKTYPVGEEKALSDGLFGDLDYHNNWLGFQGDDFVTEIEFSKPELITTISMNFLKAVNSWVFLPEEIIIEGSKDGKNFKVLASQNGDNSDRRYLVKSIPFEFKFEEQEILKLRISAISLKSCPEWHRGYGNPSWIFVDEVLVR